MFAQRPSTFEFDKGDEDYNIGFCLMDPDKVLYSAMNIGLLKVDIDSDKLNRTPDYNVVQIGNSQAGD